MEDCGGSGGRQPPGGAILRVRFVCPDSICSWDLFAPASLAGRICIPIALLSWGVGSLRNALQYYYSSKSYLLIPPSRVSTNPVL